MTNSKNNGAPKTGRDQAAIPTDENGNLLFPVNMKELTSALKSLKNKRDGRALAYHFVVAVVREARLFPDTAQELHDLLLHWFMGTLGGVSTKMSPAVGANGVDGVEYFEALWNHYMTAPPYQGTPRKIVSIYYMAKDEAEWVYEPEDEPEDEADTSDADFI